MVNFWECFICVWKEGLFCIWHYLATYSHQMELKRKVCYSNSLKSLVNLIYWFLCIHIVHRSDCFILSFLYFSPFLLFPFCSCVIIHIDPAQWPHFHGGLQLLSTLKYIIDTYRHWIVLNALHFMVFTPLISHVTPLYRLSLLQDVSDNVKSRTEFKI